MPHAFSPDVVAAVLRHMNEDHADDSLLIVRAHGEAAARSARMTGFDADGGDWAVDRRDGSTVAVRIPWPGGTIRERREVRQQIVALHDDACERLGIPPRAHE